MAGAGEEPSLAASRQPILPSPWPSPIQSTFIEQRLHTRSLIPVALLAAVALIWDVWLWKIMLALSGNDFGKFHIDAARFLQGDAMYLPSEATAVTFSTGEVTQFTNLNPPHFHLLLLPLGTLSTPVAVHLWMAAGLVIYAFALPCAGLGASRRHLRRAGGSPSSCSGWWPMLGPAGCS